MRSRQGDSGFLVGFDFAVIIGLLIVFEPETTKCFVAL